MAGIKFKSEPCSIKAVALGAKLPTVDIVAYTGGVMYVEGFGAVVVELSGLEIPQNLPLVIDHDLSVAATMGTGTATVRNGQLIVAGVLTSVSQSAQHILQLSKSGLRLQASIGANPLEKRFIPQGQSIQANGRNIVAPLGGLTHIVRSLLVETSLVTRGADPSTSVLIAAKAVKGTILSFEEFVASLGLDSATLTPEATAALTLAFEASHGSAGAAPAVAARAEAARIAGVRSACAEVPALAAHAVNSGWSVQQAVAEAGRHLARPAHHLTPERNVSNTLRASGASDHGAVLTASLLLAQGCTEKFVGKHFGEQTTNLAMSKEHRGVGLHHIVNATLHAAGRSTGWSKVGQSVVADAFESSKMLQASGFTTMSLPGILGNAAGKLLLSAYESVPVTWRLWCGIQSASNFKTFKSYGFTLKGELKELGPSSELKHIQLGEAEFENKVGTRGAIVTLTRNDIINDDLGAFATIPRSFGRMAATGLEKAAYAGLMSNVGTIFTSVRGNYKTGTDSALSITSLGAAEKAFLDQVDSDGNPLMVVPAVLGVPTSLSAASAVICRDTALQLPTSIDTAESTGNPHAGKFSPFVSPFFSNAGMTGHSDTAWYLFGRAAEQGVINVAFLDGQQNPMIEEADVAFNQLGMSWRAVFDFGIGQGDYRLGVRNLGVAP